MWANEPKRFEKKIQTPELNRSCIAGNTEHLTASGHQLQELFLAKHLFKVLCNDATMASSMLDHRKFQKLIVIALIGRCHGGWDFRVFKCSFPKLSVHTRVVLSESETRKALFRTFPGKVFCICPI